MTNTLQLKYLHLSPAVGSSILSVSETVFRPEFTPLLNPADLCTSLLQTWTCNSYLSIV